jgi:hypothetical protein
MEETFPCTTTALVQVWREPNWRLTPVKRIFIVGVMLNDMYRVKKDADPSEMAMTLASGRSAAVLLAAAVALALPSEAFG